MRTTLNLEDDVLRAARGLASHRGISLGQAVSELARRGLSADRITQEDDFPVVRVPPDARPITLEDVRRFEDEP